MAQPKRSRAWSFSECLNLSECLGTPNARSDTSTKINKSFHRVKTFAGNQSGDFIGEFVRDAEFRAATFPHSSEKPNNPIIHISPSSSRFRSLSHNSRHQTKCASPEVLSPVNRRIYQSPPKLVFGQPIVAASLPPECAHASSLSNSLLIEYLALLTTENPYGGLVGNLTESELKGHSTTGSRSLTPEPKSRTRKVGTTTGTCTFLQGGNGNDESGASSPRLSSESPRREGPCANAGNSSARMDSLKADEGAYRLKKLSAQVEVEHLRTMLHDFERTHLIRTSHKNLSTSTAPSDIPNLMNHKQSSSLFNLTSISDLTSRVPITNRKHSLNVPLAQTKPTTQMPVSSPGMNSKISAPAPAADGGEVRPHTISRREHNMIAPLSF
ncbi:hypothetical protein Aperf_G00000037625 [Anoplocephala perfoliata]